MLDRVKELAQKLPNWVEAVVVLFVAFGPAVWSAKLAFQDFEFSDTRAIKIVVGELFLSTVCVGFLYLRGWKLWENFPFTPSVKYAALAIGLVVASFIGYFFFFNVAVSAVGMESLRISKFIVTANVALIFLVSLINPLFEETFVVYYMFERLKKYGPFIFIAASSLLRVSYHLYQGWIGVLSILPFGIIFAFAFWKTKNLMPLYFAHAIDDLIGLLSAPHQ